MEDVEKIYQKMLEIEKKVNLILIGGDKNQILYTRLLQNNQPLTVTEAETLLQSSRATALNVMKKVPLVDNQVIFVTGHGQIESYLMLIADDVDRMAEQLKGDMEPRTAISIEEIKAKFNIDNEKAGRLVRTLVTRYPMKFGYDRYGQEHRLRGLARFRW